MWRIVCDGVMALGSTRRGQGRRAPSGYGLQPRADQSRSAPLRGHISTCVSRASRHRENIASLDHRGERQEWRQGHAAGPTFRASGTVQDQPLSRQRQSGCRTGSKEHSDTRRRLVRGLGRAEGDRLSDCRLRGRRPGSPGASWGVGPRMTSATRGRGHRRHARTSSVGSCLSIELTHRRGLNRRPAPWRPGPAFRSGRPPGCTRP
jgi:hypothetical protein